MTIIVNQNQINLPLKMVLNQLTIPELKYLMKNLNVLFASIKPFKNDEKSFLFHLKNSFHSSII